MPFVLSTTKVDFSFYPELPPFPDFHTIEKQVRVFWDINQVPKTYLKKNENSSKKFIFYDGPITANNSMGVHHAWGRTLKDVFLRYNSFKGKKMRFQNGFDTQGLWVEVEVEKALKLNSKREIFNFGLDRFVQACKDRVQEYGKIITEESKLLGQWMDWNNSYWTHTDKNIEHIWYFLAKCHENGWLYKGYKVMPWCPRCGTSLSQHEQSDSFKEMLHPSIFVCFPIVKPGVSFKRVLAKVQKSLYLDETSIELLVWTTTPWTLPANVAVAAHPNYEYLLIEPNYNFSNKKTQKNSWLVVGKVAYDHLEWLNKEYRVVTHFKGKYLINTVVKGPCQDFVPKQANIVVKVLSWSEVAESEGSGLVHIAPGCGEADFQLGKKHHLPVLSPLDEDGNFLAGFGFDGQDYKTVSDYIRKKLHENNRMFYDTTLTHRYPECWRCDHELVFRAVDEWFLKTDEIRPRLLEAINTMTWSPPSTKARMFDWLKNMGDWCISRKRFWGLPLPFFECTDCGSFQLFAGIEDLWKASGFSSEESFRKVVPDLHRPYLDSLTVSCPSCGSKVYRIKEVGDCWLDAGIIPFSTLNYLQNHDSNSYWKEWFPADFIVEMREQTRLWFYSMLFMSITITGTVPYKYVLAYEKVYDSYGNPMHKSKGNAVWFQEAANTLSADPNRWFLAGWDPSKILLYGFNNVKESLKSFNTFWSCTRFLQQNLRLSPAIWDKLGFSLPEIINPMDVWLITTLYSIEVKVEDLYVHYEVHTIIKVLMDFWDKISRWWLRNKREKFWDENLDTNPDSLVSYQLLYFVVWKTLLWLSPIVPHVSEFLYQVVVRPVKKDLPLSIHLAKYTKFELPAFPEDILRVSNLTSDVWEVIELVRQARHDVQIKNRYELPAIWLASLNHKEQYPEFQLWDEILKKELNVHMIYYAIPKHSLKSVTNNNWSCWLETAISDEIKINWIQADILRTVQFLRKKAQLALTRQTEVAFECQDQKFLDSVLTPVFIKNLQTNAFVTFVSETTPFWINMKVKGIRPELIVYLKP